MRRPTTPAGVSVVSSCRVVLLVVVVAVCLAAAGASSVSYVIQTVAGTDDSGNAGKAVNTSLAQPEGIAIDGAGNVYVADAADNRVSKIATDGSIQTIVGTGVAGFAGDGGPAIAALLNQPYGLALDSAGNLYIADLGNARVRKVSLDGTIQTVAGGGSLPAATSGQGGPATSAQLTQPRNVMVDPAGSLYISDFGANQVYHVTSGGTLSLVAGTGVAGFSGVGTSALLAELNSPAGLVADSTGALYVADSGNNCVRKIYNGLIITVFNTPAPTGVSLDSSGMLYVAASTYFGTVSQPIAGISSARDVQVDSSGNIFASSGAFVMEIPSSGAVSTIAGSGLSPYFGGDNGPATSAQLYSPSGIAVDSVGNWYIADTSNNRIRRVTVSGVITTVAGTGDAGSTGDNGPAAKAQLSSPRGVAIDSSNNLYIADSGNNEVRKITPAGIITTIANQLNNPLSVAANLQGSVYIVDAGNNRIVEVTSSATSSFATIKGPLAVAVDASGNVVVADPAQIWAVDASGKATSLIAGLSSPAGLAFTPDGTLFIADTGANVVRQLSTSGVLTTIAGMGTAGFAGDGNPALSSQLNSPSGLAIGANATILIADSGNNRIRTLTPSTTIVSPTAITVVNAASLAPGPLVPGEIITVFGSGFDTANPQLTFGGQPATLFYTSAIQINALAPVTLAPNSTTQLSVVVNGSALAGPSIAVGTAAPGIFTVAGGTGQAAANNQDGTLNSASNPAARGSVISLYATGEGSGTDVTLTIAGYTATLLYAGAAPGFVGLMQINAQIPAGFLPPGVQPVLLSVGTAVSQAGVTIAIY